MKWIDYAFLRDSPSGKTSIFEIRTLADGTVLGEVAWWAPWRKYTFQPRPSVVLEEDCLRDIAEFCIARTRAHRAEEKRRP